MLAHVTNLRGGSRVIPADKQPTRKGNPHAQHHPQAVSGNPRRRGGTPRGGGTGQRHTGGRPDRPGERCAHREGTDQAPAKTDEQMKDNVKAVDICCWTEGNGTPTDF